MKTLGFIGFGNMAQAMVQGLLRSGAVTANDICACAKHYDKLCGNAARYGVTPLSTPQEVLEQSRYTIIAIKPYLLQEVLSPIANCFAGKAVFSVAAGKFFDDLESLLPGSRHWTAIPNTPVAVCEGIYVCEQKSSLLPAEQQELSELLGRTGLMVTLDPHQFSVGSTLAGCGPAFAAMIMEGLADGAVKNGLPRQLAYQLCSQMLSGTAKLQLESGAHPGVMKDAVCSPGGLTIKGVSALESHGLRAALIAAIDAIEQKQ